MTSKERLLAAIRREVPDRLPVTTHHVMPYFLHTYMNGMSNDEFFDLFGLDPIHWTNPYKPKNSDNWRITSEEVSNPDYATLRYTISTPKGQLTTVTQSNEYTTWVKEHLVKEKSDIDLIAEFVPAPQCDVDQVNTEAETFGDRGLIRGNICTFDIYGQPGTWQDACCLVGAEKMIMSTYDDPEWVHELLEILQAQKLEYVKSLQGAQYDILELGGGDASTTVISPKIFRKFVAPYDSDIIAAAHEAGQRIVYHTCGGMMPILEDIADMGPDAMETFTPPGMGADVDLAAAKQRIGDRVCMIGGFDQGYYFQRSTPDETRAAVRKNFEAAGDGGGYILAPSDHFFDAKPELVQAFADEARACVYE
jgi:uroporphyrinogen-III decarboxylase